MKARFLAAVCLALTATAAPLLAQASPSLLTPPSREQLTSVIGSMGLSIMQKMSLGTILRSMGQQGENVRQNTSLTDDQKIAQILKIRRNALSQSDKILNPDQQRQLAAVLIPKQ